MSQVAIRFCQARKAVRHGLHASLTPLRFEGGELFRRRGGRTWTVERVYDVSGQEMLYLLSFYLPRFLERPFEAKLSTVVHELWHVGPKFDGDLRRHPGRCYAHSHSQKQYDALMDSLRTNGCRWRPLPTCIIFCNRIFRRCSGNTAGSTGKNCRHPSCCGLAKLAAPLAYRSLEGPWPRR